MNFIMNKIVTVEKKIEESTVTFIFGYTLGSVVYFEDIDKL